MLIATNIIVVFFTWPHCLKLTFLFTFFCCCLPLMHLSYISFAHMDLIPNFLAVELMMRYLGCSSIAWADPIPIGAITSVCLIIFITTSWPSPLLIFLLKLFVTFDLFRYMPFSCSLNLKSFCSTVVRLIKLQKRSGTYFMFHRMRLGSLTSTEIAVPYKSPLIVELSYALLPTLFLVLIFSWFLSPLMSFVIWLDAPESTIQTSFNFFLRFSL